jgi:branched-subunit amino acid ABC-type transport system permease component
MAGWILSGLVYGSIVALGALGCSYILLIQRYFNFAAAPWLALGAYFAWSVMRILPQWGGVELVIAAIVAMVALGATMTIADRALIKPLRDRNAPFMFFYLTSFGLLFVVRSLIWLIWGPQIKYYYAGTQEGIRGPWGISVTPYELLTLFVTMMAVTGLYLFQYRTKLGRGMLATAQNPMLASVSGVEPETIHMTATMIAGFVTALAGILYGLTIQIRPLMGWYILLGIFVCVVCGGEGAILGTLAAGYLVGIAEEFGSNLIQIPLNAWGIPVQMSAYKIAISCLLFLVVIYFRPEGVWKGTFLER